MWHGQAIKKPPRATIDVNIVKGAARTSTGAAIFITGRLIWMRHPGGELDWSRMPGESDCRAGGLAEARVRVDRGLLRHLRRGHHAAGRQVRLGKGRHLAAGDRALWRRLCDRRQCAARVPGLRLLPGAAAAGRPAHAHREAARTGRERPEPFRESQGPHGLRLYACTTVGGNDCGKAVAKAFCQAQGWSKADKYDTKSKKVQAETLAGEACDKNKCKVFDFIDCEN